MSKEMTTADEMALEVLHHIDTMYPAMWDGVPKTARTSLRNTITREFDAHAELAAQERVRVSVEDRLVASFRQSGKHEPAAFILNTSKREKPTCPSCMTTMHASSSDPLSLKWKCEDCEYSYPVVLPPAPDLEKK